MAKKTKAPKPTEVIRDELKKFMFSINKELQTIKLRSEENENEVAYIGELLGQIETCFDTLENRTDAAESENDELKAANTKIEEQLDDLQIALNLISEVNTMVGTIKYEADNLVDAELMDLFTECLAEIQPATMLENLKTIKEFKTVM